MSRLLAIVGIFVESPLMDSVVRELVKLPSVEELYEVTGEYDIVCLVSVNGVEELREVIANEIMKTRGVKSTVTDVILYSHVRQRRY